MSMLKRFQRLIVALLGSLLLLWPLVAFAQQFHLQSKLSSRQRSLPNPFPANIIQAPTLSSTTFITKPVLKEAAWFPIVRQPDLSLIDGEVTLQGKRTKGVTMFDVAEPVKLNLSSLNFSIRPTQMKFVGESIEQMDWTTATLDNEGTEPLNFTGSVVIGSNPIDIHFRNGSQTAVKTFYLFYIPNGDFYKPEDFTIWQASASSLSDDDEYDPQTPDPGKDGFLRLGDTHDRNQCLTAEQGNSIVMLTMNNLPATDAYRLRVEGHVFTQDQNPSDDDTYDAFEIQLNGNLEHRVSNLDKPIHCGTEPSNHVIPIEANIPLRNYSGEVILSLENYLRFDNYFNTYTEISTVWIDYGD